MSEWYDGEKVKNAIENGKDFKFLKGWREGGLMDAFCSVMKEKGHHVYNFEFKYYRQVNGKKTQFVVPIVVHYVGYVDACCKVDEYVKKNFADRVDEESTIKFVGEFVDGGLKCVDEEEKETEEMRTKKKSYEVLEMENGFLDRYVVQMRKCVEGWIEMNNKKDCKISELEKRLKEFEEKKRIFDAEYKGGFQGFVVESRGMGKQARIKQEMERVFGKDAVERGFSYCDTDMNIVKRICDAIDKQVNTLDVNSLYPSGKEMAEKVVYKRAMDMCDVYRMERDRCMEENTRLKEMRNDLREKEKSYQTQIEGYKKELGKLNMLMDDMEDRLEKGEMVKQSMIKQMKGYKMGMKRMNKIISALTEDKDEK